MTSVWTIRKMSRVMFDRHREAACFSSSGEAMFIIGGLTTLAIGE